MTIKTFLLKFFLLFFVFISLKCFSQPLSPVSPKNGIVINNDSILLRWNKLSNAQYYELKYTTDSTFINNISSVNVGFQNAYWLTPLSSNTTYYWRVEAFNGVSNVIGQARKFTNFKPTDLPGCALWLRADTGITLNGNGVQGWSDASLNNFNIVQTNGTAQPQVQNNSIAGYPSLSFDGNDILTINNFPFDVNNNGFVVAKKTNNTVPNGNITSGNYFDFEMQTYRCALKLGSVVGSYDAVDWSQISLKRKSGESLAFYNGQQSGITNTDPLNPITPGVFALGNRNPTVSSPAPFKGNLAEVIVNTTSMSSRDFFNNQNYLLDRYTEDLNLGYDTVVLDNFCSFQLSANPGFTNYLWSTGDTISTILISNSGQYVLQATDLFNRIQFDTMIVTYPNFNQINSTTLCAGNQISWDTNLGYPYTFIWQDGSSAQYFNISQAGSYYVKVTDTLGCFLNSDTVNIALDYFADEVFIGNDTSLCTGNTIQLQQGANNAVNYLWSNGSFNDSLVITSAGLIWLEVSNNNNCIARDTINITLTGIAPVADFISQNVCLGLPIYFNDLSSAALGDSIIGWEWNFNNLGVTSNIQNPSYVYPNAASYLVSLKAIAQTGCAGIVNKTVQIFPHPTLNFVVTNNCDGKLANFVDFSNSFGGTVSSWFWNFNDNFSSNNSASGSQVSHEFSQVGSYEIELILNTQEGCVDTLVKPIIIKPSPIAAFEHSKLCVGDTIKFKDISTIPFPQQNIFRQWTFNDTINIYSEFEPILNYELVGNYPVKLSIMASNGCRDIIDSEVEISNHPSAGYSYANICLNSQSNFIDTSSCINCNVSNWFWTINNNVIGVNSTANYYFADTGSYTVNLRVENESGCKNDYTKILHVGEAPQSVFEVNSTFGSPPFNVIIENLSNENLFYNWNFGNGENSNEFEPNYVYNDTGIYLLYLKVNDLNGCIDSTYATINVLPKKIDMAITQAEITVLDGYVNSELIIANLGTTQINSFDILLNTNGVANNFIESWQGIIVPGEFIKYRLKNSFVQTDNYNKADFVCFKIQQIDQGLDNNIFNNEQCAVFKNDAFQFVGMYPNPADEYLNLNFISPEQSEINVEIVDFKGELVKNLYINVEAGINFISIETFSLRQGAYSCNIKYKNQYFSKSFLKIEHEK